MLFQLNKSDFELIFYAFSIFYIIYVFFCYILLLIPTYLKFSFETFKIF